MDHLPLWRREEKRRGNKVVKKNKGKSLALLVRKKGGNRASRKEQHLLSCRLLFHKFNSSPWPLYTHNIQITNE